MYELIDSINTVLNNFIWGVPAMVCIIGVGLYLSCRTGFIQLRKLGYALKNTLGKVFSKNNAAQGTITPFQAVCTALARPLVPAISPVWLAPLPSAVPVLFSGCGFLLCWVCVPSLLK